MSRVRAAIGLPMYGPAPHAREALESLLAQSCPDIAVVVVDDGGGSREGLSDLFADPRVTYVRNSGRLGLAGNWRRAYELATELQPTAAYFAWGSDHDVWEPDWLEKLAAELDADSTAVLAYPLRAVIAGDGGLKVREWRFETRGVENPRRRLARTVEAMAAGYMVYGLFRRDVPARCGVFRRVLMPDRLLLSEAGVLGTFHQVERPLWHRRKDAYSPARQRESLFAGKPPWWARAPWWATHLVAFAAAQARRLRSRPVALVALVTTHAIGTLRVAAISARRRG